MTLYHIDFEPMARRGECTSDTSLLDCARNIGVGINSICGGQGTCHSCKIQMLNGTVSTPTSNELEFFPSKERADGWRLACQTYPRSDCTLRVPPESMTTSQRNQVEGVEIPVQPEPVVQAYHLKIPSPSLSESPMPMVRTPWRCNPCEGWIGVK